MESRQRWLLVAVLLIIAVVAVGGMVIYGGAYDVAATRQHTAPTYWLFTTAVRQSIRAHAAREAPKPPNLDQRALIDTGLVLYDRYCAACHGAPGIAPSPAALGMTPPPPNLLPPARTLSAQEIYWTVSNGIKMTAMPAWEFRLSESQRWAVVAFVKSLPALEPVEYRAHRARLVSGRAADGGR